MQGYFFTFVVFCYWYYNMKNKILQLEKEKARYWVGVLYQENMVYDWQERIGDILQLPYAYCCHTKDMDKNSEHAKDHLHLIITFSNTTTYKNAMSIFNSLSEKGKVALNKIERVHNIRHMYDYLIHDTETCKKQGKHLYNKDERITGNNFDINTYEQLSTTDKRQISKELGLVIIENKFTNYMDFYSFVVSNYDDSYFEVMENKSSNFGRLIKGNYHKLKGDR